MHCLRKSEHFQDVYLVQTQIPNKEHIMDYDNLEQQ